MRSAANSHVKMAKVSRTDPDTSVRRSRSYHSETKSKLACLHRRGAREKSGILNINTPIYLRQDPLEAILVIFGRKALIFLFESSWKNRKMTPLLCACAVVITLETQKC